LMIWRAGMNTPTSCSSDFGSRGESFSRLTTTENYLLPAAR
jgi:hypothetical protein